MKALFIFMTLIFWVLLVPGTQSFGHEDDYDPFNIEQKENWVPKWSKGSSMIEIPELEIPEYKVTPLPDFDSYKSTENTYRGFDVDPLLVDALIIEKLTSDKDLDTFEFLLLLELLSK